MTKKNIFLYILIAFVLFVFLQSLPFKFGIIDSPETEIIFSTIADWMKGIGLGIIAPSFESFGGIAVGATELVASILLVIPATRRLGALLGLAVISGAIFFHLFTPLSVDRVVDEATQKNRWRCIIYDGLRRMGQLRINSIFNPKESIKQALPQKFKKPDS